MDKEGRVQSLTPVRNTCGPPCLGAPLYRLRSLRGKLTAGHSARLCPSTTQPPLTLRRSPRQLCRLSLAAYTSSSQGMLLETASHRIGSSRAFRPNSQLTSCAAVSAKPVCSPEGT